MIMFFGTFFADIVGGCLFLFSPGIAVVMLGAAMAVLGVAILMGRDFK